MFFEPSSTHRSLRSSLYPFVRNPITEPDTNSAYTNVQDSTKKIKRHLLQRYHDQSFIIKQKPLTRVQKYAKTLNRITKMFLFQKQKDRLNDPNFQDKQQNLTFHPQSRELYIWNVVIALSIFYHFFQIPICLFFTQRAFHSQFNGPFGLSCNIISLFTLLINIVYVVPNTQYYHNGFLVTNQEKIIQKYIGWRLIIDSIAYIALFVFVVSNTYSLIYFKLVFYLMGYRLMKVDDCLQRKVQLLKVRLAAYKLFRLILLMLFLVLWLGSIFFAIDYHYYQQGASAKYSGTYLWLTYSSATNFIDLIQYYDNWLVWLDYSLYWAFQTVSMVGFGDVTGKNPVQVTYVSLVITFVVVTYAFFITGVWQIIAEARQFTQYQNKQWKAYKEYQRQNMRPLDRKKQVSEKGIRYRQLKNKVGSYLIEMWSNQKTYSQINILQVLEKSLTPELKDEIFINYRQHLFQRIDLFRELEEVQEKSYKYIFRELIFKITQKKYAKQQVIINDGQLNENLIYLVNGKLSIQYPNSNYKRTFEHNFSQKDTKNAYIDKNNNFGVKQFFTQQRMPFSVVSESFCKTSELSEQNFLKSIKQVEQFYIKYCELRDQLKLYNKDSLTGQQCIECGSNEHDLNQCEDCDVIMCYKKHWMKISMNKMTQQLKSKDNCPKIPFRRRDIKSNKVKNVTSKRIKLPQIQKINNFNVYFPSHNLLMV